MPDEDKKSTIEIYTKALDRWPRETTPALYRKRKPFKTSWNVTLKRLKCELKKLDAKTVILQLQITEEDISPVSGLPRGDRQLDFPGVIVAADTRHGALKWICDDCADWRANVHAIALTLERLRLADLYGVTGKGEQYAGWKMLPGPITAGAGTAPAMTIDEAARFVATFGDRSAKMILDRRANFEAAFRFAAKSLHPDVPGHDPAKWKKLEEAAQLLNNLHQRK